jgi:hypothetical protein
LAHDRFHILIFTTIHDVLKAERTLQGAGIDVEVLPVPRSLSSDCGVCIKSAEEEEVLAGVLSLIAGIRWFVFDGTGYKPTEAAGSGS